MWISSTTQYAIRAVLFVAEHSGDRPLRVEAIAEALQVPRNYLSKTLHLLAREGVLRSERGRGGGFRLGADASALTLAAVAAPFGDLASRHCLLGRSACGWRSPCAVHARWEEISNALQEFFQRTTIADLQGEIAKRPGTAPHLDGPGVPRTVVDEMLGTAPTAEPRRGGTRGATARATTRATKAPASPRSRAPRRPPRRRAPDQPS